MTSPSHDPDNAVNKPAEPTAANVESFDESSLSESDDTVLEIPTSFEMRMRETAARSAAHTGERVLDRLNYNSSFYTGDIPSLGEFRALLEPGQGFWRVEDLVHLPSTRNGAPISAYFVSDLHGRADLLASLFKKEDLELRLRAESKDPAILVVGGDSIDRTKMGSNLLDLLYSIESEFDCDSVIELLGNHERHTYAQEDSSSGGFRDEVVDTRGSFMRAEFLLESRSASFIRDRLGIALTEQMEERALVAAYRLGLWRLFNENFRFLPKMAFADNGAVFIHAGITDKGPFASVRGSGGSVVDRATALRAIASSRGTMLGEFVEQDLIWSDYAPRISRTGPNTRGGRDEDNKPIPGPGLAFGAEGLDAFLALIGQSMLFRGHQHKPPEGVEKLQDCSGGLWTHGRLLTIDTSHSTYAIKMNLCKPVHSAADVEFIQL